MMIRRIRYSQITQKFSTPTKTKKRNETDFAVFFAYGLLLSKAKTFEGVSDGCSRSWFSSRRDGKLKWMLHRISFKLKRLQGSVSCQGGADTDGPNFLIQSYIYNVWFHINCVHQILKGSLNVSPDSLQFILLEMLWKAVLSIWCVSRHDLYLQGPNCPLGWEWAKNIPYQA